MSIYDSRLKALDLGIVNDIDHLDDTLSKKRKDDNLCKKRERSRVYRDKKKRCKADEAEHPVQIVNEKELQVNDRLMENSCLSINDEAEARLRYKREWAQSNRKKKVNARALVEVKGKSKVGSALLYQEKTLLNLFDLRNINFTLPTSFTTLYSFQHLHQRTTVLKTTVKSHPSEIVSYCDIFTLPGTAGVPLIHSTFERGCVSQSKLSTGLASIPTSRVRASRGYIKKDKRQLLSSIPTSASVLKKVSPCCYCDAKKIVYESDSFCCGKGTISLDYSAPPVELLHLLQGNDDEAKHFRQYIRPYNNMMAFTSLGIKFDKKLATSVGTGIYTFRVLGQVHHFINSLLPRDSKAEYLQLYFYDTEHEVQNRTSVSKGFDEKIVKKLIRIADMNPYCRFFRSLKDEKDLAEVKIVIRADPKLNQKLYNSPTQDEVALIWTDNTNASQIEPRDIVIFGNDVSSYRIQYYYACYDSLQYVIFHPRGEPGWHTNIRKASPKTNKVYCSGQYSMDPNNFGYAEQLLEKEQGALECREEDSRKVAIREYYAYKFQIRPLQTNIFLLGGRLFQQFIVDMYVKIETSRLDFFRFNQEKIRAELYSGVVEALAAGETKSSNVGKRIILPSTFIGGPRDMTKRYLDAMALVRKFGRPDLFITMTCNPNWPEIIELLEPEQVPQDRPDLIARVFKAKLKELKNDIVKKMLFGPVAAYVFVIEFQKRGLPHVHMLIILNKGSKLTNPHSFDEVVSAEIPDPEINPHLHDMVKKHMMHGPCGKLNIGNCCMKKNGKCKSGYPKAFQEETVTDDNEYAMYRRRDNGRTIYVRNWHLDNRWVVPYSPYLLAKYNCHINVEICSTIKAVKYLYKYIYKGHDRVAFNIVNDKSVFGYDEISSFQSGRWVSPPEAAWRIFAFPMYGMKPSVLALQIHLENEQFVVFHENNALRSVISKESAGRTMLTEFFRMNACNDKAKAGQYLYIEFPEVFTWSASSLTWNERKAQLSIGRINSVSPVEGEKYYLRLLLSKVRGPTSFRDLLVFDNQVATTFREASVKRGLILADDHIESSLQEASLFKMPAALRQMFCSLLVYCNPIDPKRLWNLFEFYLSEDISYSEQNPVQIKKKTLSLISKLLESMGKKISDYGLVDGVDDILSEEEGKELKDELSIEVLESDILSVSLLNEAQKIAYDTILQKVDRREPGAFFIDGPGGTGKTFLYRAILATVRSRKQIALATASSGVAASLLPGGRTAHSRFKIPIDLENMMTCNVGKRSGIADLIRKSVLIIWDEASMANKLIVESVNRMLQDINSTQELFGGKVVVFGGDFRQVLPVIRFGRKEEALNASLVHSHLWPLLHKLKLTENMRARLDPEFSKYLMRIGDGIEQTKKDDQVRIPQSMLVSTSVGDDVLDKMIVDIYPDILSPIGFSDHKVINHAILTPRNESVNAINNKLMTMFPGDMEIYRGFDETINPKQQSEYEDLLHSFTPNGLPPYELCLKKNCPVMLIRNINPAIGLCNGTRIICRKFDRNVIHGEIAVGDRQGENVLIHRIPMQPSTQDTYPVLFKRTQFPIKPSFCMTINKAQGQTLDVVGLYLPQPVFSHGQLYVALSRAKMGHCVRVLLEHNLTKDEDIDYTSNIVYSEVFDLANQ